MIERIDVLPEPARPRPAPQSAHTRATRAHKAALRLCHGARPPLRSPRAFSHKQTEKKKRKKKEKAFRRTAQRLTGLAHQEHLRHELRQCTFGRNTQRAASHLFLHHCCLFARSCCACGSRRGGHTRPANSRKKLVFNPKPVPFLMLADNFPTSRQRCPAPWRAARRICGRAGSECATAGAQRRCT